MKLILDPASCKPFFGAPHHPLSSLPTQQQHDDVSSTSGHCTSPTLSGTNIYISIATAKRASSYRLLSAAIFFVPFAIRQPRPSVFRPDISCSLSVITSSILMTRWQLLQARILYIQRASARRRQPTMWWERLPLGTAVGPPGAARLKTCVHTLLYVLQRVSGEAAPRRRTNADCLKILKFLGHAAS